MTKAELIEEIVSYVYTNGRGEITGANLQDVLVDMVNILGAAAFLGVGSVQDGDTGVVTGDAVYDALTTALSNYVPTSRKVNNHALTADITLTLDDIGDGVTRVLNSYFTEADGVVRLKNDYSYFKPRLGLIFDVNSVQNTPAELMKVNVGTDANPVYALKSTLPFFSESWISAGGVSSGGGQAAGNASMQLITGGGRITNGTDTLDVYSMSNTYTKQEVNSLIGSISGFKYEIYASLGDITQPSASVLYLIGPTGSGADKYEEYVYSNSTFVKIGDTSIDLSGYATQTWVQQQGYLTSHQTIYALTIKNSGGTTELTYTPNSGAGSITLTKGMVGLGNVENTALSTWAGSSNITTLGTITTGTWHGSTIGSSYLPSMYIGRTAVAFSAGQATLLGIDAISNASSSGSSDKSRIVWDSTNNAWHFLGNVYADGFVSAGGISSGGGTPGIDLAAMWASLQNNDIGASGPAYEHRNDKFHLWHMPAVGTGLSYTTDSNNLVTGINLNLSSSLVTSALGYTPVAPSALNYYVLKAGDTMSGTLSVCSNSNSAYPDHAAIEIREYNRGGSSLSHDYGNAPRIGMHWENVSWGNIVYCWDGSFRFMNNACAGYGDIYAKNVYEGGTSLSNKYLSLNGGTLTGTTQNVLGLDQTGSGATGGAVYFYLNGTLKGTAGYNSNGGMFLWNHVAQAELDLTDSGVLKLGNNIVLHAGNYSSYALPLSGGTMNSGAQIVVASMTYSSEPTDERYTGGIQLREYEYSGAAITLNAFNAPGITFHWNGRYARKLWLNGSDGSLMWDAGSTIYHSGNLTKSVLTGLLDASGGYYLPLTGGTISGTSNVNLTINNNSVTGTSSSITFQVGGIAKAHVGATASEGAYLQNAAVSGTSYVNIATDGVFKYNNTYSFYHSGNSNKSDVPWTAEQLHLGSKIIGELCAYIYLGTSPNRLEIQPSLYGSSTRADLALCAAGGNVGIGTNSPAYKLDVNGSVRAADYIGSNYWLKSYSETTGFYLASTGGTSYGMIAYYNDHFYLCNYVNSTEGPAIGFYDNGNICLDVGGSSHIGIGTNNPSSSYRLDVRGGTQLDGATLTNTLSVCGFSNDAKPHLAAIEVRELQRLGLNAPDNLACAPRIGFHWQSRWWSQLVFYGGELRFMDSTCSGYSTFRAGNIYSEGNVIAVGAVTAGSASDISFKSNIKKITAESAKSLIMAMNPVTFTWNSLATSLYDKYVGDDLGLVAQEVEPYLPMAISPIFEKYKRLDYTKLIAPIIRVEQDHETRIQQLERESREKDAKIAELENQLRQRLN